ncbi:MAG: metal-dependent phosphohydrolase [Oscillatoriaceae cyanobacterium Prado104]|jgi:hypothetical protein|nr:metal-dependent phosphohydrolase [Oscillatoriaceae cyanobacterium Prado104]
MFNLSTIAVNSLTESLKTGYRNTYGNLSSDSARLIEQVVSLALGNIACSDALYHNIEHTILVTLVGQEILRGKYIREGNVSRENWLEAIVSWLCHDIGYVKGVCSLDKHSQRLYATGTDSNTVYLEPGKTDASLTNYHIDRGKMFIKEHFSDRDSIDTTAVARNIELTRFPVPNDAEHSCTANYPGLVRAADLIGQLSDPHYLQKMPALFYEFEEIGTNKTLGYCHPGDLRAGYPKFFWNVVYQYIKDGLQHLEMTEAGKEIIANLYGNVLTVEQEIAASATNVEEKKISKLLNEPLGLQFENCDRLPGWRNISTNSNQKKIIKAIW